MEIDLKRIFKSFIEENKNTNLVSLFFVDAFDREFKLAYNSLNIKDKRMMRSYDQSPNMSTIWARTMFNEMILE